MPFTPHPLLFDVVASMPGLSYDLTMHVDNRATQAGAVSHAMGRLIGKERTYLMRVAVQECGSDGSCWNERGRR